MQKTSFWHCWLEQRVVQVVHIILFWTFSSCRWCASMCQTHLCTMQRKLWTVKSLRVSWSPSGSRSSGKKHWLVEKVSVSVSHRLTRCESSSEHRPTACLATQLDTAPVNRLAFRDFTLLYKYSLLVSRQQRGRFLSCTHTDGKHFTLVLQNTLKNPPLCLLAQFLVICHLLTHCQSTDNYKKSSVIKINVQLSWWLSHHLSHFSCKNTKHFLILASVTSGFAASVCLLWQETHFIWVFNSWSEKTSNLKMFPLALGNLDGHFSQFSDILKTKHLIPQIDPERYIGITQG